MLPSTGNFKEINCPFFDSGLCERPYCHFRHVKKDTSEIIQTPVSTVTSSNPALVLGDNGEIIQQIVSEAVRKVFEQADLPSALGRTSGTNAVENVSRNLVTKVTEALVTPITSSAASQQTYNVPTTSQKVPSYKPTPISVLKNRHIPIPYSPSLSKSFSVLRKRCNSNEFNGQKKLKTQSLENTDTSVPPYVSVFVTSKVCDAANASGIDCKVPESPNDISQYSPAPVKGWRDNGFKYTPSSIESLIQNSYVPCSSQTAQVAEYEPTEKSESSVEPSYVPQATNGTISIDTASYEPSQVSNSEPEYQPLCCDNYAKEYVPTDKSKLESLCSLDVDITPEIDLLHDLLHDELSDEVENTGEEKTSDPNELGSHSERVNALTDRTSLNGVENPKKNQEKNTSDRTKKKSKSDKKKTEDHKKDGENSKRKDSSKKRCDTKKSNEMSSTSSSNIGKIRTDTAKRKDVCNKMRSDNDRKKDHCDKKLQIGDKKRDDCYKRKDDGDGKQYDADERRDDGNKKRDDGDKRRDDDEDKKRDDGDKKRDNGDKRRDDGDKRRDDGDKKKDDGDKKKDNGDKKNDDGDKKREDGNKKREAGDKKRNENRKKVDCKDDEQKQKDEKRSEKKHSEHHHKKSEIHKKLGFTAKKKSKVDVKKKEIVGKKHVSRKDLRAEKHSSNNSKPSDKNLSVIRDQKVNEKSLRSGSGEHSHSAKKSVSDKKFDESKKSPHSHKMIVSGHSSNRRQNRHGEGKHSKSEEHSKPRNTSVKRRSSESDDLSDFRKSLSPIKKLKTGAISEDPDTTNQGTITSESEESDSDVLDKVTLPADYCISSSDEETVTKECYKIFQECGPEKKEKAAPTFQPPSVEDDERPLPGKHRVAHDGAENSALIRPTVKRSSAPDPAKMVSERYQKVQVQRAQAKAQTLSVAQVQVQAEAQEQEQKPVVMQEMQAHTSSFQSQAHAHARAQALGGPPSSPLQRTTALKSPPGAQLILSAPVSGAKKRIAHVPNVSVFLNAKVKMQQKLKEQQTCTEVSGRGSTTTAQTVEKGKGRVAHMPAEQLLSRPIVKGNGGKIPSNVRQNYLNILVEEYLKICSSDQEAFEKAEAEESAICARSTTRTAYTSHVSNTVNRLRKAAQSNIASTSGAVDTKYFNRTVSHMSMLAGRVGTKGSWSIEKPRKPPANVTNKSLYASLSQFILSEEELKQNGFPTSHEDEKGLAVIHHFYKKPFVPQTPLQRMCARCSRIYYVNQQGFAVKDEQCLYHWGRLFQSKTRGGWEARYNCCQGYGDAIGCSVGSCHVSDNVDPTNLRGFVKTLPKENPPPDGDYGVYALDCEMCYTTVGLELTRVTVVGSDLQVVYETLVKPQASILDYNTKFSGIKEEDLANVTTTIYDVQAVLLSLVNDKTILIGHSLESDFKALKIIHGTVVDTSVVYPHKMGPPKKRALKTLCRDLLHKIIQESEGGHDSTEDARAAMEVMLFRVKEDLKSW